MTRSTAATAACIGFVIATLSGQGGTPASLDAVLRAAGTYLLEYEKSVAAIVAEEDYIQNVEAQGTRQLRSDMLVILDPAVGWVGFRDVFEVDGQPIRDRDERLQKLFMQPNPDSVEQARRIVEEGSRYNLNPRAGGVRRTINQPFLALKFLRTVNQPRSEFKIDGSRTGDRPADVRLVFTEKAKPRLIASPDSAAATGSFRVDTATGCITASELRIQTGATRVTIRVTFAEHPKLKLWLPRRMDESYSTYPAAIEGRATYSNFRQFKVETETIVK